MLDAAASFMIRPEFFPELFSRMDLCKFPLVRSFIAESPHCRQLKFPHWASILDFSLQNRRTHEEFTSPQHPSDLGRVNFYCDHRGVGEWQILPKYKNCW